MEEQKKEAEKRRVQESEEEGRKRARQEDIPLYDQIHSDLTEMLNKISIDVTEMYSPPRVTARATEMGLKAGEAFDLTTGWDFRREEDRK